MNMHVAFIRSLAAAALVTALSACRPELPVISSITIEADGLAVPVNPDLYGVAVEEINHGIDGGLYAELIRNRSFEDGVPPLNCPYDAARGVLVTPNGWTIPFPRKDSIPGWRRIAPATQIYPDAQELINDKNRRSLLVAVSAPAETGRGGVIAEGYRGIAVRKGERYRLSLFAKGGNAAPRMIRAALEDSLATAPLSDVFELMPAPEWRRYEHTFTAHADAANAVLTITTDTAALFWLDVVSLFPERTWKGRTNGLRPDLAALVDSLSPRFIRFPGGSFVEGYTAGTFPLWRETLGDISERRHFWNVWGYGSTNGMGFHEYLQMCEDMGAESVYVVNSGVTSQSRRPRYEDITAMGQLTREALDAIAYANAPADSALGELRARNGHPEPFNLRYVEIGSENRGPEYARRFELFREAIREAYPDITVISSSIVEKHNRGEWADSHFHAGGDLFLSAFERFEGDGHPRRQPPVFIGEFGTTMRPGAGTLRAAVAEACFLLGAEANPDVVRRLAYAPLLGNAGFESQREPLIAFDTWRTVVSPSYHLLKMLAANRGDELLPMRVDTYRKPQVGTGRAGIELFDNSYEFEEVRIDGMPVSDITVAGGGWTMPERGRLVPAANRWNQVLFGDSTSYAYDYEVALRRTKGSGQVRLRLRDNGRSGEQADYLCMTIGTETSELFHQVGGVRDSLVAAAPLLFESNRWYKVRMTCENERVRCYVDGELLHEVEMRPIPSLVSVATLDKENRTILLKVVNTTYHEEKTSLAVEGATIGNEAELIQLKGEPEARNTFEDPGAVAPVAGRVVFPEEGPVVYSFPPNSITILKFPVLP